LTNRATTTSKPNMVKNPMINRMILTTSRNSLTPNRKMTSTKKKIQAAIRTKTLRTMVGAKVTEDAAVVAVIPEGEVSVETLAAGVVLMVVVAAHLVVGVVGAVAAPHVAVDSRHKNVASNKKNIRAT